MPCGVRFSTGTADGGERCSGFGINDSFHRADSTHGNNNTDRTGRKRYEGASNLFGPWAGAALTQELDRLAQGIVSGQKAGKGSSMLTKKPLGLVKTATSVATSAVDVNYGKVVTDVQSDYYFYGDYFTATFSAARTRHITTPILQNSDLVKDYSYMEVQVLVDGKWETYLTDTDPYTTFNYQGASLNSIDDTATVGWLLEGEDAQPGTYRLVYHGIAKTLSWGKVVYRPFTSVSRQFEVL